jgi:hypothetical protein
MQIIPMSLVFIPMSLLLAPNGCPLHGLFLYPACILSNVILHFSYTVVPDGLANQSAA